MKKGTTQLSKFKLLAKRLALPDWQVVGLLESMWLFAQAETPRGDIGSRTDEAISIQIGIEPSEWRRARDAMIAERWLIPDSRCRFVVNDFAEHAPEWLKKQLSRAGVTFWVADGGGEFQPLASNGGQRRTVAAGGGQWQPVAADVCPPNPPLPSPSQPSTTHAAAAPPSERPPPASRPIEVGQVFQAVVWNGEITTEQRRKLKAVWNSTPGLRASDFDLRQFGMACAAVERWQDGPPEARANPPDWLIARAERFMASDQARKDAGKCKGPLGKWLSEERWMRSEEQEADREMSADDADPATATLKRLGLA